MSLYNLFRNFLLIMYMCFYRRVYYLNSENIPKKDPLIFISNHSNGFMDPILIAAMQRRPVYFWTRASELSGNIKGKLMRKLHALPIYRAAEGKENMHRNEATFQETRNLLYGGRNGAFIAPEGNCKLEKRLRPFKTGCARLAFKMMEEKDWGIDVKVLPSGVNYTYHDRFRSEVYVKLGVPISVQDYKDLYQKDSVAAVQKLTEDMWGALKKEMIHVEPEDAALTEKVLVLVRNSYTRGILPLYSNKDFLFQAERKVAAHISNLDENGKAALKQEVDAYYAALDENRASDYAVANKNKRSIFGVLLGFPFWIIGTLAGKVPHIVSRNLRNKFVPYREFSTSFAFTAAFFIWILWSLLFVIVGAFFIGWWALLLPIEMIFFQTIAYHYEDYFKEWKALTDYKKIKNKKVLEEQRAAIECLHL